MALTVGKKLGLTTALFSLVAIIPFIIMGVMAVSTARDSFISDKFEQLVSIRGIKKSQIENFFDERKGDMGVLNETVGTLRTEAFKKLEAVRDIKKNQIEAYFRQHLELMTDVQKNLRFTTGVPAFSRAFVQGLESQAYKKVYDSRIAGLEMFMNIFGYYDVFLIDPEGNVVFTVAKESDWGTNLINGPLKDSGLARAFQQGKSQTTFVDYEWYEPSNEPASFLSTPLQDADGQLIGVAAFQVSLKEINAIMGERSGMGETGETYLVGPDLLMRSDSYLDQENHTVAASFANPDKGKVDTRAAKSTLAGDTDADVIIDYNGNPVLSAFTPITVGGLTWALIAEIDVAEAFCPKDESGTYFFKKYIEKYGYYDLFLINPDGYVFYTVTREADYQTNMVNGKYSNSNLGRLVKEVLKTNQFGIADFEPYAPSNDEPAAFIAQPVLHNGEAEIVVALQLSLEAINNIMQQREGMGKTGETYLVGPDKLMRSDSFLDPQGHSVKASFAGTVQSNGVDTEASREAISGKTGEKIVIDYNGNPVLSAYTTVKVGDTAWAMLAEIDEAEVVKDSVAARNLLTRVWTLGIISFVVVLLTIGLTVFIIRNLTGTLRNIVGGLSQSAEQTSSASGQISQASQQLAEGANEQASGLEESSSSLEEMASMTKQNADNARQANTLAGGTREAAEKGTVAMKRMSTAIEDIKKSSDETAKIIKTIDEIAFQTNLLALNAAVEAARAGEAGKGFAVVAEEVRNLAQRSAEAAKNTSSLIEESKENSDNGVKVSQEVGTILEEIVGSVRKVTDLVGEVAAASEEQSKGIDQVNSAVAQMDKVTQQNASNAEESASGSEELNAQAAQLKDMVGELVALVGGSAAQGNGVGRRATAAAKPQAERRQLHVAETATGLKKRVQGILHKGDGGAGAETVVPQVHADSRVLKPEEVIPLDDKEKEFADF